MDQESLIEELNKTIQQQNQDDSRWQDLSTVRDSKAAIARKQATLPSWGVVVRKNTGELLDVFGQVNYEITQTGHVEVPGYEAPPGSKLEVVPQSEYLSAVQSAGAALDPIFRPLSAIPDAVIGATDFLANRLCARKGRPSSMTLSLVVSASGSIFWATVGTEAGSEISWDLQDVCSRYGLEGDGISFN